MFGSDIFDLWLSAAVICRVVGMTSNHLGNSYRSIQEYARCANLTPWQGCMRVMSDTEKVLNLIMDWKSRKELQLPKRDEELWVESKVVELHSNF